MRVFSYQFVLGALCAGRIVSAEGPQKPLQSNDKEGGNPFTDEFGKHADELLKKWHVPGMAIGVVDGDNIWTEGYGIATYPSTPVTPSTLFYCASTSKAFTAATLSMMIASGNYTLPARPGTSQRLDWNTPVHDIIPEDFVLTDPWATTHITIEDALSHRTGLPRHDKASTHRIGNRTATVRDGVRFLRYLPLNEPPRTKWQYCNQMYVVATHAIETLTGRWLGDVLKEWIWTPLGMNGTYFSLEDAAAAPEHLADGYVWDHKGEGFLRVPFMPTDEIGGAGSVMSNAGDYTKWIRSLLREDGPVPKEGHAAVKTPRMITSPGEALPPGDGGKQPFDAPLMYGLGWGTSSYRGHKFWCHSGGMHAYGAEVYFFPDLNYGLVTLGNTAITSNALGLILLWELVDDKLGVPKEERHDWAADWEGWEDKTNAKLDKAISKYYPNRPVPPQPPSLPIEAYTGTYFHPGYLNFTLTLAKPGSTTRSKATLEASRTDATWQSGNEFEHVTGEYWMMFFYMVQSTKGLDPRKEYAPAQFRIGADGRAEALGITWLSTLDGQDTVEGLVWFDRVE
ncbi:Penicillin-binding protein 4 [Cytospora mali]|uniref:Penicillin-binding protein 4 n=1 Tax=Cytospora mali TaxID=578113 RepID=A0A194W090_CYTMA|nr:Penicillin-binding protein 4 [Valsa mali]